jgi:exonuclease III
MHMPVVCTRARALSLLLVVTFASIAGTVHAQTPSTFKLAYYNIQSGKGEPGLPGTPVTFADNHNCSDPSTPMNAWGVGLVQAHLRKSIADDPAVVSLGLGEAWFCGSPENVRQALGWKARSSERNGVAIVAKYGFAGAEEWVQLDTSLNTNPSDTMWVLGIPVCLDAGCTSSIKVFTAHWHASGTHKGTMYDRQAAQTVDFLKRAGGADPHVLLGDLNVWRGVPVCRQNPNDYGWTRLRDAGYLDAWPLLHGSAEGYTGMTNRAGCGVPTGYTWKRIDYAWSPANYPALSMTRFGVVTPGHEAPSDHFGIIAEFTMPGSAAPAPTDPPPPPPSPAPAPSSPTATGEVILYAADAPVIAGNWKRELDPQAAGGARLWNPDQGAPRVSAPQAAPANYFELTFAAEAGRGYRLWIRGAAQRDHWGNDSVYVQFNGSVTQSGAPVWRIGTSDGTWVNLEDGVNAGLAGWGWQDNGYGAGVLGPLVYFSTSGPQTIRVQTREDGFSIDQVVLSPRQYLTTAPGGLRNDATILTAAAAPAASTTEILLTAPQASTIAGTWSVVADATAAGGRALWNPDAGAARPAAAAAAPANYVELTFTAEAGRAYRLWLRGRADRDHWANDSAFVQFSGAVTASGAPLWRIGTTDSVFVNLEDGVNAGLSGWGWQDNGYGAGVLGPLVQFAASGSQTIRIQTREDGFRFDQVVLSSQKYLTTAPGALKNDATILK